MYRFRPLLLSVCCAAAQVASESRIRTGWAERVKHNNSNSHKLSFALVSSAVGISASTVKK